jgi:hypothetical protein
MLPRLALAALAVLGAACSNQTPPPPVGPISLQLSGTYALLSVNNDTVPAFLINNAQQVIEVVEDVYVLRSDFTWSRSRTLRNATPPTAPFSNETFVSTGTYFAEATSITLHNSPATSSFATFAARNGTDLVVQVQQTNQTLVYKPR